MGRETAFEVRVLVKGSKPREYNAELACFVYDEVVKMFHKWARTARQAMKKCRRYGRPISARKVDVSVMHKDFEKLPLLNEVYMGGNAMTMDEMIWRKRNKRRANLYKDKRDW